MEPLLVACLCAQWCGVCRDWQPQFTALAERFPQARWLWVDVEDQADAQDGYEPENFPVLAVQRGTTLLYCATLPQQIATWERTIRAVAAADASALQLAAARQRAQGAALLDLRRFA